MNTENVSLDSNEGTPTKFRSIFVKGQQPLHELTGRPSPQTQHSCSGLLYQEQQRHHWPMPLQRLSQQRLSSQCRHQEDMSLKEPNQREIPVRSKSYVCPS